MFPRKNPAQLDECPYGCPGRDRAHQRPLTDDELGRLSTRARDAVAHTLGHALICEYCGGVHLRETARQRAAWNSRWCRGSRVAFEQFRLGANLVIAFVDRRP